MYLFILDIDECILNSSSCINSDCFNQNGSFSCGECYIGFVRIGNQTTEPCRKYIDLVNIPNTKFIGVIVIKIFLSL